MTRRTDTYTAVTPFGAVEVDFLEDGGNVFIGDDGVVDYLKSIIRQCVGQHGIGLTAETIDPVDLVNFCQPKGSGILIIEPIDSVLAYGPILGRDDDAPVLDAVSPIERLKLTAELTAKSRELVASKALNPIQRARMAQGLTQLISKLSGSVATDPNMGRKWASRDGEIEVVGYFNGDTSKYITTKAGKVFGAPIIPAAEIESYVSLDVRHAESHARWEAEVAAKEQVEREAKAARDTEYADIGGEPGESAMARARRVTALSALIRVDGAIKTKKRMVDDKVAAGETTSIDEEDRLKPMSRTAFNRASNSEQEAHAKRVRNGGKVSVYQLGDSVIDKIAYDYANYLISKTNEPVALTDSAQAATNLIAHPQEKPNGNEAAQALETKTQGSQAPATGNTVQLDAVTIPDDELEADDLQGSDIPDAVVEGGADLMAEWENAPSR